MRLVFRHVPFYQIKGHEFSRAAAALCEMAAEQGKFKEVVGALYERQGLLNQTTILELMKGFGFDPERINARLSDPADPAIARVLLDEELAERLDITATPTFIVLVNGQPPISANQRTLPQLLNSPRVLMQLAQAASRKQE